MHLEANVLTCCGRPCQLTGSSSVSKADPWWPEVPLEGCNFLFFLYRRTNSVVFFQFLTQKNSTLAMVDHDNTILELGGEVEGEARPWQTWLRWWDPLQHVVHDVLAGGAAASLQNEKDGKSYSRAGITYQVLFTLTFRKSLRGTLMPLVATNLKWAKVVEVLHLILWTRGLQKDRRSSDSTNTISWLLLLSNSTSVQMTHSHQQISKENIKFFFFCFLLLVLKAFKRFSFSSTLSDELLIKDYKNLFKSWKRIWSII